MQDPSWMQSIDSLEPIPALGDHVVARLRRAIISGDLPTGTHLVEAKLSSRFSVSRGPIRDALRQLEVEGLVESKGRGIFVRGLSEADIEELYLVREVIEAAALRACCERDDVDLAGVEQELERMRSAWEADDREQFARADLQFHTAFYRASGYRRLESIWQHHRPTFAEMLALTNMQDGDLEPTLNDHALLLEAVRSRDVEHSLEVLRRHIDGSRDRMRRAYAELADHIV